MLATLPSLPLPYRGNGLLVDVDEALELALTAALGGLGVVGQAGTGKVERVDKAERHGAGDTARGNVAGEPLPVAVALLLKAKEGLDLVLEGKVEGLRGEVADDVGDVATPERGDALVGNDALGAVADALVALLQAAALDHLVLVLQQQLDALNGRRGRLGDGGSHAAEEKVLDKGQLALGLALGRGRGSHRVADVHLVQGHGFLGGGGRGWRVGERERAEGEQAAEDESERGRRGKDIWKKRTTCSLSDCSKTRALACGHRGRPDVAVTSRARTRAGGGGGRAGGKRQGASAHSHNVRNEKANGEARERKKKKKSGQARGREGRPLQPLRKRQQARRPRGRHGRDCGRIAGGACAAYRGYRGARGEGPGAEGAKARKV